MADPVSFSLFDGQPEWTEMALVAGVAFVVATTVSIALARAVREALTTVRGPGTDTPARLLARPVLVTRIVSFCVAFVLTALPLLDVVGQPFDVGLDRGATLHWVFNSGLRIAVIVTVAWLVLRVVATSVTRLEREIGRSGGSGGEERLKRAQTLGGLVRNSSNVIIGGVALLMILEEMNVNILPMLTGAGIVGMGLGFGAQWLVRDLIAGFFLILEDQVRVGDSVVVNGQGGTVEAVTLRTVVLRDVEGAVHIFPNGAVNTLANRSRDYAYTVVDLALDFQEDSDRVAQICKDTAAKLRDDPAYASAIVEPLEMMGIEAFRDGQVLIRARLKTVPQRQAEVGRELRRRLRYALDQAGVDLAPVRLQTMLSRKN